MPRYLDTLWRQYLAAVSRHDRVAQILLAQRLYRADYRIHP